MNKTSKKAGRGRRLVVQHLEGVSWRVMQEYPEIVRDLIREQSGIYALYNRDSLYYVGLASNLMARLKQHLRDRHERKWDRFSVYLTVHDEHMKELESLILRIVSPSGNLIRGGFTASESLNPTLRRSMVERDKDRRARLLGGKTAVRRLKTKTSRHKGIKGLEGLQDRRLKLRAHYKGYEYTASLRRDGTISYAGDVFSSPTGAAKAIVKRNVSGWKFWKYRDQSGEWVPLSDLRH
jgi:hypothetical protein